MKMTPWYAVGRSYQCSMRAPYCDLEVLPVDLGWQWRVCKIDPVTGRFAVVQQGTEGSGYLLRRRQQWTQRTGRGSLRPGALLGLSPCAGLSAAAYPSAAPSTCPPGRWGFLRLAVLSFLIFCGCAIRIREVWCLGGAGTLRTQHGETT